jgi:hypothetical protein
MGTSSTTASSSSTITDGPDRPITPNTECAAGDSRATFCAGALRRVVTDCVFTDPPRAVKTSHSRGWLWVRPPLPGPDWPGHVAAGGAMGWSVPVHAASTGGDRCCRHPQHGDDRDEARDDRGRGEAAGEAGDDAR